jgi:hypothetical protein
MRDDFTTRCTETCYEAKQFTQKLVLAVYFGGIPDADKTAAILYKSTKRLFLLL